MALGVTGKAVAKNMSLSVLVQAVSTMAGIVINLVVPKFIDTYQYAYWQTFLLYMQYVGFFHFGLIDGLVLRYSQFDYEELDKDSVRSQYYLIGASGETVKENFELSLVSLNQLSPILTSRLFRLQKIVDSIAHVHNNKALQFLTPNRKLYFSFQRQMYHCQSDLLLPKVKRR